MTGKQKQEMERRVGGSSRTRLYQGEGTGDKRRKNNGWEEQWLENDGLDPLREVPSCPLRATSTCVGEPLQDREYLPMKSKPAHHGIMEN